MRWIRIVLTMLIKFLILNLMVKKYQFNIPCTADSIILMPTTFAVRTGCEPSREGIG